MTNTGEKSVKVVKTYAEMEGYLASFRDGVYNLVVLVGSWGIGKSQLVRAAVGDDGCWIEGTATAFAMYREFFRACDKPIVLDDIDGIYANKHAVSLLKAICRSAPVKRVSWNARNGFLKREGLPEYFTTKSKVIIICNEWKTLNKNVEALEDRAHIFHFEPTVREIHARAGTWFQDQEIYDWFGKQLHRIDVHSFRAYEKAADHKLGGHPWKEIKVRERKTADREAIVAELLKDDSFSGTEDRFRSFALQGGGSRATYYAYRRKILGLDLPPEPPRRPVGRPPGKVLKTKD